MPNIIHLFVTATQRYQKRGPLRIDDQYRISNLATAH
jgi:hypothetical protein